MSGVSSVVLVSLLMVTMCQGFIASWDEGATSLTWHEAESWCQTRGMRMVSMDSFSKASEYLGLLTRSGRPYFWTGGFKSFGDNVRWPSGHSETVSRGRFPWQVLIN